MKNPTPIALVAIVLTAFNLRTMVTAISPLVPDIQQSLGVGSGLVGILGTIPTIMFALSAFSAPRLMRHLTVSQALAIAMAVTGLGQITRVLGPSVALLLTGTALALFAIGITNAVLPLAVRAYFPTKVSALTITYLCASQVVQAVAPVVVAMKQAPDWQLSLGSWGLLGVVAALAWIPLLHQPKAAVTQRFAEGSQQESGRQPRMKVWRTKVGVGIAVMFGTTSFTTYILMAFIPQMYVEAGLSRQFAASMLAVWSILGGVLNIVGPWIVSRFERPYPWLVIFGSMFIVSHLGLAFAPAAAPWLWIILSGLGPITFPVGLTLVNIRARTMHGATALSSFGQGMGYSIAACGPVAAGFIHEHTGSFHGVGVMMAIASVCALVGGFFATRTVYVEDQLQRK
ncbi:MFS transporter [Corynebacterium sp. SCR221107]|uniref:MFS transporter n=1 Tax=Corynebacterium sp. SCR221107 TaxID=3017361 RepID=UPI0022EC959A|nr:MFS transporter [Corynebacterium sp. SCR221107]WBT09547.1 MFS transporter [Corynebacterium sp. SCR221107]